MSTEEKWYGDGLRFKCTQCGNCCTGSPGYVWFDDEEAAAMAEFLDLPTSAFLSRYSHQAHGSRTLNETKTEHGYDCTFLRRDETGKAMCSIYHVRPRQCRTWPFWNENLRSPTAWQRTQSTCPGAGQGRLYPIDEIRILRDTTPDL